MSFESKLREHYLNSAKVGDMKGYGLSGGEVKRYPERVKEIITDVDEMHSASFPMAGFRLGSSETYGRGLVDGGMCHVCGSALSGGKYGNLNMMPLSYGEGRGLSGGDYYQMSPKGSALSGGRRKSKSRVEAGKKAAAENPWVRKLKEHMKKTGMSYKQSMMALKGK